MIRFYDIKAYLDVIAAKNGHLDRSPHGRFWGDYTTFTTGQVPGVGIPIMDQGNPLQSPFYLILTNPQGFQGIPQMPPGGPFITDEGYQATLPNGTQITGAQIATNIAQWLSNQFPQ
ncbi:MAG: hypothetical protein JO112_17225 [Planctomycetes bacterium]|nr:hypothetical protein [Planctomycetota bacterium]